MAPKHGHLFFLCVLTISSCYGDVIPQPKITTKQMWNATMIDKLRHDLLLNYDKFARPAQHNDTTTVKFGLSITHIDVNEFRSTLTVHSWTRLYWTDSKLHWNTWDYGGVDLLHLAEHEVWQPDLFLYNSATATPVSSFGNTHCLLYPAGDILWVPPTQYTSLCTFNLKYWPFDTQKCELKFGSWTYHGNQIDLVMSDPPLTYELIAPNVEWEITGTTATRNLKYYNCCAEAYPDITVTLTFKRKSDSYRALVITPAFAIIMLTLMNFCLPPASGEKVILNGCNAIIITLFLIYFSQKLPLLGSNTPLVVLFFSTSLYVVCFATATAIFILWLARTKHSKPLPWGIKQLLVGRMGRWLNINPMMTQASLNSRHTTAEEMRDHQVADFEEQSMNDDHHMIGQMSTSSSSVQNDWLMLASAVDRISFIAYSLLFAILAITYSL